MCLDFIKKIRHLALIYREAEYFFWTTSIRYISTGADTRGDVAAAAPLNGIVGGGEVRPEGGGVAVRRRMAPHKKGSEENRVEPVRQLCHHSKQYHIPPTEQS